VSSIIQAKAEAQKLIKRYNALQAEAKTADTAEEAARKAGEADKVVSQISALQLAITKLQAKNKTTTTKKTVAGKKKVATATEVKQNIPFEKTALSDRLSRLEEAQRRTRTQIEQLTRAKAQLAHLKQKAEKSVAHVTQERRANEEKLQQELARLINKKEAEHQLLRREMDAIRQQAKKDSELLKVQRDAARAMMERQKQAEEEQSLASIRRGGNKGLFVGVAIGIIFSLILGGVLISLFIAQKPVIKPVPRKIKVLTEPPPPTVQKPKKVYTSNIKALGMFRDKLKNGQGPLMVKLSGGRFMMGNSNFTYTEERPQHKVTLQSFSISRYEVTFDEYDFFADATKSPYPKDMGWGRGKRPVINVNWNEATKYTEWLTKQTGNQYRLPSEREWEYAAAAGTDTAYWWGYEIGRNNAVCGICGSRWDGIKTAPVGSLSKNPLGLYDTIGNVMEWTISCYRSSYDGAPEAGQRWEGGNCSWHVARSSSFRTYENGLRTTKRNRFSPGTRIETLGFRVVRVD
jgi:formylglycine-generating enzyme required for sulfatase activity